MKDIENRLENVKPAEEVQQKISSPREKEKFQKFVATLLSLQNELENGDFSSTSELAPFMTVLDEVLSKCAVVCLPT